MSTRSHAEIVQEALQAMFPEFEIDVDTHREQIRCAVRTRFGTKNLYMSPQTVSYRHEDPKYWVHRFAQEIRKKETFQ